MVFYSYSDILFYLMMDLIGCTIYHFSFLIFKMKAKWLIVICNTKPSTNIIMILSNENLTKG